MDSLDQMVYGMVKVTGNKEVFLEFMPLAFWQRFAFTDSMKLPGLTPGVFCN